MIINGNKLIIMIIIIQKISLKKKKEKLEEPPVVDGISFSPERLQSQAARFLLSLTVLLISNS